MARSGRYGQTFRDQFCQNRHSLDARGPPAAMVWIGHLNTPWERSEPVALHNFESFPKHCGVPIDPKSAGPEVAFGIIDDYFLPSVFDLSAHAMGFDRFKGGLVFLDILNNSSHVGLPTPH